jgi:Protein of unknown function (DUF3237)
MPIELIPLCHADAVLAEPIVVGEGPHGVRIVVEVEEATLSGDRINGRLKGRSAADWITVVGTTGSVDVRLTFETDDAALVFVQYRGRLDLTNGAGSAPVYVAPTFETSAPQYAWLNLVQAVGKGSIDGHRLHYEWFEVR